GDLHSPCDSVFPSDVACRLSHDCGSVSANRRMRSWSHSIVIDRRPLDSFFADLGPGEELIRVDAERATDGWSLCVGVGGSGGALADAEAANPFRLYESAPGTRGNSCTISVAMEQRPRRKRPERLKDSYSPPGAVRPV